MAQTWTVYTYQRDAQGYTIYKSLWTNVGPVSTRVARVMGDVTAEEARTQTDAMQRSYDETRRALINE